MKLTIPNWAMLLAGGIVIGTICHKEIKKQARSPQYLQRLLTECLKAITGE